MGGLLEINNVTYSLGTSGRKIMVSSSVKEGGFLTVKGPSGSGKTTLLRILARLWEAEEGQVFFNGTLWTDYSPVSWRRKIHYLAQKPVIFDGTVIDNLMRPFELGAVKKELVFVRNVLDNLMERLLLPKEILHQDARSISGGEASRIALLRALLVKPSVLLMDEPLAALDSRSAMALLSLMSEWVTCEGGRGIALVSHMGDLSQLPGLTVCDIEGDLHGL